jgi:pseudouridine-5'-phosphate glycosidase
VHLSTQESDASDSRYHEEMNVLREFCTKSRKEDQVDGLISVRDDVAVAIQRRAPVVALESTVIAHGLPRPHNLETARKMETVVREAGATPATIGILDGKMVVGLTNEQIAFLAEAQDVAKVSRSDVSAVLASGRPGATTVAGTMFIAARADIHVFATGGIGGVHRGSENTYDISADLTELSRTPVAVVCAGAKAILDLPRTVEVLETLGIPVVGYGTNEFPAFYSWGSGLPLQHRVDSPDDVARLIRIQWDLGCFGQGFSAGIVIVNPPPAESALARAEIESLVVSALEAAELAGIRGKSVTPFLLEEVGRTSRGKTLETNIALLIANARLAARIAVAYSAQNSRGQCVVSR